MTKFGYLAALLLALTFTSRAHAQLFYNNTLNPGITAAYTTTDEMADDTPFTGTQHVGAFTFSYMNLTSGPISATVRFYGVMQRQAALAVSSPQFRSRTSHPRRSNSLP